MLSPSATPGSSEVKSWATLLWRPCMTSRARAQCLQTQERSYRQWGLVKGRQDSCPRQGEERRTHPPRCGRVPAGEQVCPACSAAVPRRTVWGAAHWAQQLALCPGSAGGQGQPSGSPCWQCAPGCRHPLPSWVWAGQHCLTADCPALASGCWHPGNSPGLELAQLCLSKAHLNTASGCGSCRDSSLDHVGV